MEWKLDNNRPIYMQLLEQLINAIVSGEYLPGQRLPSVRELAAHAAVNPNTMQRAFAELEARGLVCTQRTNGRTITDDKETIHQIKEELAHKCTKNYLLAMQQLGYCKNEAALLLNKTLEE